MNKGEQAPDFDLPDQHGTRRKLSDFLAQGPLVLFFYPIALSSGCTAESCHFRDLGAEFAELGAQRAGISNDTVERQLEFDKTNAFGYPLLSDEDGAVATAFGVRRTGLLAGLSPTRRQTFVIDTDRTILDVVKSEVRMQAHAEGALKALRARTA
ncbi:peroxiredoxin [Nocardiopsis ansamitocini]|uniref:thioredoxin-dependent peroxiredoxin n=1 Tax=Nocardiopsis ansamitocini TaxID=1670832 RepID=A0A9W6P603_9ACTN|nr:peroxiredoxin [Nocardiopsis ansamitocini]GLU48070.1 putative peroxidoxin BcpB [Nocardiopsis ansamitocini]